MPRFIYFILKKNYNEKMYKQLINIFFTLKDKHRLSMNTYFDQIDYKNYDNTIKNWMLLSIRQNKVLLWEDLYQEFKPKINQNILQNIFQEIFKLPNISLKTLNYLELFRKNKQVYWNFGRIRIQNEAVWKFLNKIIVDEDYKKNLLVEATKNMWYFDFKKIVDKNYFDQYLSDYIFLKKLCFHYQINLDHIQNIAYLKEKKQIELSHQEKNNIDHQLFFQYLRQKNYYDNYSLSIQFLKKYIELFEIKEKIIHDFCMDFKYKISIFEYNILNMPSLKNFIFYETEKEIREALETQDESFLPLSEQQKWIDFSIEKSNDQFFEFLIYKCVDYFQDDLNIRKIFRKLIKNQEENQNLRKIFLLGLSNEQIDILKSNILKPEQIILDKYRYDLLLTPSKKEINKLKL